MTASDDAANNRTNVTVASGGHTIHDEGSAALTQRAGLNFTGTGVVVTDDAANNRTDVTIVGSYGLPVDGNVPSAGWSWDNQGTATIQSGSGIERIRSVADAGGTIRIRYRTAPAAPYTLTAKLVKWWPMVSKDMRFGICFRQASSGKLVAFTAGQNNSQGTFLANSKWNTGTSFSADYIIVTSNQWWWSFFYPPYFWMRIQDNGTNLIASYSPDSINWEVFDTRLRGDWMTGGPDQIGFFISCAAGGTDLGVSLMYWQIS